MRPIDAAKRAGVEESTMRKWCERHAIGRKVVGNLKVSRVALEMLLDGDSAALAAYHKAQWRSDLIRPYFARVGLLSELEKRESPE